MEWTDSLVQFLDLHLRGSERSEGTLDDGMCSFPEFARTKDDAEGLAPGGVWNQLMAGLAPPRVELA